MYGGYYSMNAGMRQGGGYGGGPMIQQQQLYQNPRLQQVQQLPSPPPHMQAHLRGTGQGGIPSHLPPVGASGNPGQLRRNPSFMMMYNDRGFGQPNPMMQRMGSFNSMGSMGMIPRFDSFRAHGGGGNQPQRHGSFSSCGTGAGSLRRVNSGMNFDYSSVSQVHRGGSLARNNSYGTMRQPGGSFFGDTSAPGGRDQPLQQLSRQNSAISSYNYGSFRQPSFAQGSVHNGATGVGPGVSANSINGMFKLADSGGSSTVSPPQAPVNFGERGPTGAMGASGGLPTLGLSRQDSARSLQRKYSIAGQFYNYGDSNNGGGGVDQWGAPPVRQQRLSQAMPGGGSMMGGGGMMALNANTATVQQRGGIDPVMLQRQQQMRMQQQSRMMAGGGSKGVPSSDAPSSKGTSESTMVQEGQPQMLGRKNSVQNLTRKNSEKRVGMYFKNKETEQDGVQYKKDGDPGTSGKNSSGERNSSQANTVKASLLLDIFNGRSPAIEVDGRTIRASKPGAEEVQKYDMHDVMCVNRITDIELSSDSLEEIRDNFLYGCNAGLIMADSGCSAARPTEWFTWLALKSVVKGTFGRLASATFEFTVSVCLLQDDQVMDLLSDSPQRFVNLTVAESPLFGNVANGMVYVCVEDAGEFNDVLEASLQRAQEHCSTLAEEQGIVLCTCVLKQVRTSPSSGKEDVIVSSIFASGVGDGVIHYNRIIDKNPAEPRALFYSVMHRSVHSTALFSCGVKDRDIFNYLSTLQRFSKIETRRPKVGSARAFVAYGTSAIPRIREELKETKDSRQRMMMQRQLEKLELMVADAEDMLRSPADCVPKTYI
ncbi:hypothetical protein, conserved [Leishmania tarentolae]|uniref:Uncharacterized protein n=1 Tax=Leishmania tarentolae TaxID=5689 RepID=A0A640KEN6_LEITA|nr:hypothetical protein, conserved [Leishmania tarentolae]